MKILQINNYHFLKGGSETVYLNTGKLLESKGHDVIYFSTLNEKNIPYGINDYFVNSGNPINGGLLKKILNFPSFLYNRSAYRNLNRLLVNEKPDIAHLHIFYGGLTSAILKALNECSIPVVMSVHEYKILCPTYTLLTNTKKICEKCGTGNYGHCVINKCNKGNFLFSLISAIESVFRDCFFDYKTKINHFIMVSDFIRRKHVQYYPEISNKSTVIYNFQSLPKADIVPVKECDLVYFGRLSKEKGLMTLLECLKRNKKITLKLIGVGPLSKAISEFVKINSMNNIEILGFQSGNDLWNHVKSSRFTIVPSEWYENNPMSVIESLFLGVPVIGANIGGIPEIVKNNHGFLHESGSIDDMLDKIKRALNLSSQEYYHFCENGQKFANEMFSENVHYEKLIEVYSSLIKSRI